MQQHATTPTQLITGALDIRDKVNVLVAEMLETKNAQMELLELQELVTDLVENMSFDCDFLEAKVTRCYSLRTKFRTGEVLLSQVPQRFQ